MRVLDLCSILAATILKERIALSHCLYRLSFDMKKPAASKTAEGLKRPASAINSFLDDVSQSKSKKAKNDEDESEGSGDQETPKLRNKAAAEKFAKMLKAGALPPHISHMWLVESKKAASQREFQTDMINKLMVKKPDGRWKVQTDHHQFEEYRKVYQEHSVRDKSKGLPRGVMLASHFHGNADLMDQSIKNGELVVTTDEKSGLEFLAFRQLQVEDKMVNQSGERVSGQKKLNKEEAHCMAGLMGKLKWTWAWKKAGITTRSQKQTKV